MVFEETHWEALRRDGYTIVSGAIAAGPLRAAQEAADRLNAAFPDGWERSKNESWREIRYCREPAFMALVADVLDPLTLEILESAPPVDYVQLAATFPGFATKGRVGRNFHIDGGQQEALGVFNVLLGVALTDVASDTAGSFHVLPGSHEQFAALFKQQPTDAPVHWGEVKLSGQRQFLRAPMTVPRLEAGDIVVAHSFLAHGTSANTTDARRDMFFQRRAAQPLWDPARQASAREAFMRNPWMFFRRP
ncbi:MAG: phytanoyl-CoA dioxygenase family protein [Reyranella sp.]|uniref:phytanoyl-CoA dioxygenase family protein n=1 Tax=Reyranella sp. TaxID=1929291 RepID=UPI001AD3AF6F|nr:phytanoyl-CoA dioxygenase family protein [Reyranella sp.]MBN9085557.1 phytanoyl-CoA dioxygenase family protein [Reyranella sp.]